MEIFNKKPSQWGLRGDPELWEKLRAKFVDFDYRIEEDEFAHLLYKEFENLIEEGKKTSKGIIWFKDFSQQGMSGGYVSSKWWYSIGLPHLVDSYKDIRNSRK